MSALMEPVNHLITWVSQHVESFMTATGPLGVVILMAIESCNFPLPSEIVLPFAGYMVSQGQMNFHVAAFAGALGCVVGSVPSYWIGLKGGPGFIHKYGKWLLITPQDLKSAENWVERYGDWAFFICRMLPVVRTFISLPAGVLKAHFPAFVFFTFIGSLIWSYGLVYVGVVFGRNKALFSHYWHQFDALVIFVCLVLFVWYVYKHVQHFRQGDLVE